MTNNSENQSTPEEFLGVLGAALKSQADVDLGLADILISTLLSSSEPNSVVDEACTAIISLAEQRAVPATDQSGEASSA